MGLGVNKLEQFVGLLDAVPPFSGMVPAGYTVDFLGTLTDVRLQERLLPAPGTNAPRHVTARAPTPVDGEVWLEAVDWFVAAREARERFVMMTLGAWYGAQAVGSFRALQRLNPMPAKLVIVEGEPNKRELIVQHLRDNGIDPAAHWLLPAVISDSNAPVLFPVGARGIGGHNCVSTNDYRTREQYVAQILAQQRCEEAVQDLLLRHTTRIKKSLIPGEGFEAEIKLLSAVTLADLLGPFDRVDYLEADIQQAEGLVFPPFLRLLREKVRRIHIGTHGTEVHADLLHRFEADDWDIVFNFAPDSHHQTDFGSFRTGDGVLTVRNRYL